MKYITKTEISTVIQSTIPVLLEFRSFECPACLKAENFIQVLDKAYIGKLLNYVIDVDLDIQQMFSVSKVPLFVLFKHGKEITRITGFSNEIEFEKNLRIALKSC